MLLVFESGLFDDYYNDERFYGFCGEGIVLREAVADSDFDVNEVSSVHTSDWSKRAMVTGTKISRSERVELANAANRRSIHRNKSP